MIEAQAMGIPVVCTRAGGMAETMVEGHTGLVAPAATPESLANTVLSLLEDRAQLATMGAAAYEHARQTFSLEKMVARTIAAYHQAPEHRNNLELSQSESASASEIHLTGILKVRGYSFVANLPEGQFSDLDLWEDDHLLGSCRSNEAEVREIGHGHCCIIEGRIYFSSHDGTDPRFNGHSYRLRPKGSRHDNIVIDTAAIKQELGHCFLANLKLGQGSVRATLWEDDTRLGPAASLHDEIRLQGKGRYSVWHDDLYLSTSDNTDPRINGRTYVLRRQTVVSVPDMEPKRFANASLERAMRHLTNRAVARQDFIRGRVLHVCGNLGPGGAERQVVYTLSGLAREPIESAQLLCYYLGHTDRHDFYLPAMIAAGVPVRAIRHQVGPDDVGSLPFALREVKDALSANLVSDIADLYWEFFELRPEVVHAWLDGNIERVGLAAALAGVPRIVLSGRNMNPTNFAYYQPHMDPAYRALLDLPQVTMLNNCVAGRDDYADWLHVGRDRIQVIYNGIDFGSRSRSDPAEIKSFRRRLGLDENAFVIGGTFRFAPEKRPLLWVETAAEIMRRLPDARCILFGQGEMLPEMEKAAEDLRITDRLIFAGITADVLEALSCMDVFLLTSAVEGLPNVVLEAQWVGAPVVATQAGGTQEAVCKDVTGWITNNATVTELAERVVWLHDHPEHRAAAQKHGPEFVRNRFAVERMVQETLQIYGLSDRSSRPNRAATEAPLAKEKCDERSRQRAI
jgi:glycosyltransferase involved in cell wall biosynthesis